MKHDIALQVGDEDMLLYLLANQPPDFWRDSLTQLVVNVLIALVVGLSTVLITIWAVRKQQTHKKLTYQIISDAPLASVNKAVENRVTILLDGQPVQNAKLLVIKVQNTGNAAIKHDDYEVPLTFIFPGRTIVGSNVLATEPANLINAIDKNNFIQLRADTAEMEKFLFNPNEAVTFTVFLIGNSQQPEIRRGRLVGGQIVKYIQPKKMSSAEKRTLALTGSAAAFLVIIVAIITFAITRNGFLTFILAIITLILEVIGFAYIIIKSMFGSY